MGIPLTPGEAHPALQQFAQRAQAGDKQAQYDLGLCYEMGLGVPVDRNRARKLYRLAASDSGGTIWIYTPPVSKGTAGRVMPVETGPRQPGLAAAQRRLEQMEADQNRVE